MNTLEFTWQNAKSQKIFAHEWKPQSESRAVVTLIHGLGEHTGRYQYVAEILNQAGFGLIGFDIAGHGNSAGTRGHASFEEVFADVDYALEEAARRYPGKPRFLYGHSMGGSIGLYYLLKRKPTLSGAVITSPGLAAGEKVPGAKLALAKIMAKIMPSFTLDNGLDLNNLSRDPLVIRTYKEDALVHPRISAQLGLDLLTRGDWILEHAAELSTPLLIMQGTGDHIVSPAATAAFARAAPSKLVTYKTWEGLYHETHNEPEREQVLHYMTDWMAQQI
jgi:alpha-beta hydrolase superfamily lysophospholipase